MDAPERTRITYDYDRLRSVSAGILEAAATIFLLLIAVRHFHAGPWAKAAVASGGSLGLLLTPWIVSQVQKSAVPPSIAAAQITAVASAAFLVMGAAPFLPVYVVCCIIALTASTAIIPLLTQIYHENYDASDRGRRFARAMMIRIAAAALFSEVAGRMLSQHIERWRILMFIFAAAAAFGSFCLARCPSSPLFVSKGTHPFRALRFVREDRLFRQTLLAWMFLGFAMLMMTPLRVEYLANARYGVRWKGEVLTAGMVALLTGVIPNIARLILNPVWGWLFDKMNFFVLRLSLNLGLILGILSFFVSGTIEGLLAGAVLFGISSAGADVAWGLWVTKFAPAEHVADYMSIHTFFTGLRGVVAPAAAFYMLSSFSFRAIGVLGVVLILAGSAFLIPEVRFGKRALDGRAAIREGTETSDA